MIPVKFSIASLIRSLFTRNRLPVRRAGDTLNRRRMWSARDKILFNLNQILK